MHKAIIFDMDGTLIDVTQSYKEAILRTVLHFVPGASRDAVIREREQLRGRPGFNNDWDASYYLIRKLEGCDGPVVRDTFWHEVRDIFQSHYLGVALYRRSYGREPPLVAASGLIDNERVLIREETLKALRRYPLGIATSRTRFEALHAVGISFLGAYFDRHAIISQDDVTKEKPDPEPIRTAMGRLGASTCVYVGDTVDDAAAARAAGCESIIVGGDWGDAMVRDVNDILALLS